MPSTATTERPSRIYLPDAKEGITEEPTRYRILRELPLDEEAWYLDGMDDEGRTTEDYRSFATQAEAMAAVPEFAADNPLRGTGPIGRYRIINALRALVEVPGTIGVPKIAHLFPDTEREGLQEWTDYVTCRIVGHDVLVKDTSPADHFCFRCGDAMPDGKNPWQP